VADEHRDRMTIHYLLPISGAGKVELLIESRLKGPEISDKDAGFILQVMDKVTEFARIVHPEPTGRPEMPAVLRGVSTQDRGQRA
jgi:hypothetical protein